VAVGGGVVVATGERWSLRGVAVVCSARARRGSVVVEGRRSRVEGWRAVVLRGRVARGRSIGRLIVSRMEKKEPAQEPARAERATPTRDEAEEASLTSCIVSMQSAIRSRDGSE
jgi:hypothetical protein